MSKVKKDKEIKRGKVGVIKKDGKVKYSIEAKDKDLMIEYPEGYIIEEKDKSALSDEERSKLKEK